MKIFPKQDSRNLSFHNYSGQTSFFEDEFNVDSIIKNDTQPSGDVACTAYMVAGIGEDKDKVEYSHYDLFNRILSNTKGADPLVTIKECIKNGLLPVKRNERVKSFSSYFSAHTGIFDAFDNVRSSLKLANYSIGLWGEWHGNWGTSHVMQKGTGFWGYHAIKCTGWKIVKGETVLVFDAFLGRELCMGRELFNKWASSFGFGSVVMSTQQIDKVRIKTWQEQINDLMVNLVIQLNAKVAELLQQISKKKVGRIPSLYELAYSLLGKHLTLNPNIDKSVGCGQAMSYVLKKYGAMIPYGGISGTASLYEWLKKNATEVSVPRVGCIVIYVTGTGNEKIPGHVFVNGYRSMMSNSSKTGLWSCDWTIGEAKEYYEDYGGLKPHYFVI